MLTLPADRACNVIQTRILRDSVVTKEVHDARKTARRSIDDVLAGRDISATVTYGTWEDLPIADGDDVVAAPASRRILGPLQAETLPTDDPSGPFPGLEPPVG